MGKMLIKKPQKTSKKFICELCYFECSNKKDFNRHLSTTKHKRLTMANEWLMEKTPYDNTSQVSGVQTHLLPTASHTEKGFFTPDHYECKNCKKVYSHLSSLCKHKKTCLNNVEDNITIVKNQLSTLPKEKENEFKDLVLLLLKENKEIQQNFLDILPMFKGSIVSNSNNTTTTNNQFNINMFLNDHCKNAMNLTEFIHSLPITNETYDHTIENGLTKTITNMITNGLSNMDVLKRPIHCTDPSRKIMYIKENDVWEKDNELMKLLEGIKILSLKQRTNISKWQDANVQWKTDEKLQTKLTNLVFNSMTDIENDEKECNKIIRAISKNTYLSNEVKNIYTK
jgi:hypothetical protein